MRVNRSARRRLHGLSQRDGRVQERQGVVKKKGGIEEGSGFKACTFLTSEYRNKQNGRVKPHIIKEAVIYIYVYSMLSGQFPSTFEKSRNLAK